MKPFTFQYSRAENVDHALSLIADQDADVRLLAGGQSLIPLLNLRLSRPATLIDINSLSELSGIANIGSTIRIGAVTRHAQIEDMIATEPSEQILKRAAHGIGYRAIRNKGTMGGSLAHADPAADWPVTLAAMGAVVEVRSHDSQREIAVDSLSFAPFATQLSSNEAIIAIRVPRMNANAVWGMHKLARKSGEFAFSSTTIVIDPDRGHSRLVLGGTGSKPLLIPLPTSGIPTAEEVLNNFTDAVRSDPEFSDPVILRQHRACVYRAYQDAMT